MEKKKSKDGGNFGDWFLDEFNLPAYNYTCIQTKDPNARTRTTGKDSIDHWHQVGNDRVTLTAHNDGRVQFFFSDRGLQWISFKEMKKNSLGGAITFIEEDDKIFTDLFKKSFESKPEDYTRIFGCGYFKKVMKYNGLLIEHFIYPPFGDDPVVISDIKITNLSNKRREVSVYEYWSAYFKYLISSLFSWLYITAERKKFGQREFISILLRTLKNLILAFQLGGEQKRNRFTSKFLYRTTQYSEQNYMIIQPKYQGKVKRKKEETVDRNYYQYPIFMASLNKNLKTKFINYLKLKKDKQGTFKIKKRFKEITKNTTCMMVGHEISLNPSETKHLNFIFGTSEFEKIEELIKKYQKMNINEFKSSNFSQLKENLITLSWNKENSLSREVSWHSYYMRSANLYDEYFKCHYMPQGNAYGFLHGVNAAIRDFSSARVR